MEATITINQKEKNIPAEKTTEEPKNPTKTQKTQILKNKPIPKWTPESSTS